MPNETLARRYADAVFHLARERGRIVEVGRDLHRVTVGLHADPDVERFFLSPVVDRGAKERLLNGSFGTVDEVVLHTVLLLVRKRREGLLVEIVRQYDEREREARGAEVLRVTSARALDRAELDRLVADLERTYRTRFDVQTQVDPALIGGVRLTLGDRAIDGTVAGRLDDIARGLAAAP